MAMFPSMSVTPECVNLCKVSPRKGESRDQSLYQCSVLSCAWKAPRVLTGSLASTTQPYYTDRIYRWQRRSWLRDGNQSAWRAEDASKRKSNLSAKSKLSVSKFFCGYESTLIVDMTWALSCSFSNPDSYDDMDPKSLWESLKPCISYLVPDELNQVHDALKLAFDAHSGQRRRSGEPFIIHPVEVAIILGELELDWESIAAGLLHDTVEDTDIVTFDRIEKEFGKAVRNIVEGETKVSKLGKIQCTGNSHSKQDLKADDLRQMFLAMTDEVRVIIVKLADRLHNMRTLSHMPQKKQKAIAKETLEVFAPLAKLLGMYEIKSELECLSFMYTNPSEYNELNKRVKEYSRVHEKGLEEAKRVLKKKIEEDEYLKFVTVETEVRPSYKELYSIYKSMCESKSSMNKVNEMAQLRIIIKPKTREDLEPLCSAQQVCYHVLGLVHGIWTPVPGAVKDYIATPKPNNYQCLHTTVIPFLKESMFRLEVQIRTEEMDLIAERGIAAHYRGGDAKQGKANQSGWLNAIREWQQEFVGNMSSTDFVATVTGDLLGSRVFVFTPKGEMKNLPKGATAIDYAYLIHTDIGNKMVKAKVNGNHVEPTHVLANAEVVEIITSDAPTIVSAYEQHMEWLHHKHVKTRCAQHKIKKFLREHAARYAHEMTYDRVKNFGKEDFVKEEEKSIWEKILSTEENLFTKMKKDPLHVINSTNGMPKKWNVDSIKLNGSASVKRDWSNSISTNKEVPPGLEIWKAKKITIWHSVNGNSIQWLCVIWNVRERMMSDVTSALAANGITISSCVAEIDRRQDVGVMLFHFKGSYDNLVSACMDINSVRGVRNWSVGCSLTTPWND